MTSWSPHGRCAASLQLLGLLLLAGSLGQAWARIDAPHDGLPPIQFSSGFDSGNGELVSIIYDNATWMWTVTFNVKADPYSIFDKEVFRNQFAFKLSNVAGRNITTKIGNFNQLAWPEWFMYYNQRYSWDSRTWASVPLVWSEFNATGGQVTTAAALASRRALLTQGSPGSYASTLPTLRSRHNTIWVAYSPFYSYDRQQTLLGELQVQSRTKISVQQVATSPYNRSVDLVQIGTWGPNKVKFWFLGRAHPGETLTSWFLEALLKRVTSDEPAVERLLEEAVLFFVPMLNPDGVYEGNERINAVGYNLNRLWNDTNATVAQELYGVQQQMHKFGVDWGMDVHGDTQPCNFMFWPGPGIPGWDQERDDITKKTEATLEHLQGQRNYRIVDTTKCGYPPDPPGSPPYWADTWMSWIMGAVGGTFELSATDTALFPDTLNFETGMSPERSEELGAAFVEVMQAVLPDLQKYRGYKEKYTSEL